MSWIELCDEAFEQFPQINPDHLVWALRHRFDAEKISRHFNTPKYEFLGNNISLSPSNSVLIEFSTLKDEYPDLYNKKSYKLLMILNMGHIGGVDKDTQLELDAVKRKDNIDKVLLWSCVRYEDADFHNLKRAGIDVFLLSPEDARSIASISHYLPVDGRAHNYALAVNLAADLLFRRLKKMFHLVLSEVAAPIYNSLYATQKVATTETMKYEEKVVEESLARFVSAKSRAIAVDVGCGTGRHTFPLAAKFDTVYAFDFSPLMIDQATEEKEKRDITNVLFSVADMEYENVRDEHNFYDQDGSGKVNAIIASFGLGSFIEDTTSMMRRFHGWLADDGLVVISFYNSSSILSEITPNWRDTSLAAHLEIESSTLRVELSQKTVFHIFCKPYSEEVRANILEGFDIMQTYRFPTLMALMPNELLQNSKARGMFRFIDETLAEHKEYKFGHYVTVVAKKRSGGDQGSLRRVLAELERFEIGYELLEHPPVLSSNDVLKYIDISDGVPVKTLLFRRKEDRKLVACVVSANKRVDMKSLAAKFDSRRLYFGSDRDVLAAGFPLGGIAPTGAPDGTFDSIVVDSKIFDTESEWVYTGSGDNRKTLKLRLEDFRQLMNRAQFEPL